MFPKFTFYIAVGFRESIESDTPKPSIYPVTRDQAQNDLIMIYSSVLTGAYEGRVQPACRK